MWNSPHIHSHRRKRIQAAIVNKNRDELCVSLAIKRDAELIPVLVNNRSLDSLPTVTVDMGAVPHVVGGADIMAPGVRSVRGDYQTGQFLVVVDEKHGKRLAVGKALLDSANMRATKKGRVVENVHWVGDSVWDIVKPA